ncbi:MAG: putative transport system permease protein, partial [Acidimicrobiaceae bacterium]
MTAVAERSRPARRAIVRWAWRLFRREWRQQALILTLLTVAVAAAIGGASIAESAASTTDGRFGDAMAMMHLDAQDPIAAQANVTAIAARWGTIEVIGHAAMHVAGVAQPLDVRAQDPHGTYGHPTLALLDGRYPTADDEVALTDEAAAELGGGLGATVTVLRSSKTVVGRVENPRDLNDVFVLVPANANIGPGTWTILLGTDRPIDRTTPSPAGAGTADFPVEAHSVDTQAVAALVVVAATLGMALVGLIAAAGFVVVAQRRQHQLGLLAAIGAAERHLRLVVLANGFIAGVTSAIVGAALGVGGWFVAAPLVERAVAHRVGRFDLPWSLIAFAMALAVLAAVVAAWWPARAIARVPVMAALAQRPERPRPVHRSLLAAIVLLVAGVGAIAASDAGTQDIHPPVLIVGLLAVVAGTVLAVPTAIRSLAAPASRLPFAPRLALRDLVRHQSRASAALAAITLALAVSIAVAVIAQASVPRDDKGNLSDRELLVSLGQSDAGPPQVPDQAALERVASSVATIAATVDHPTVLSLEVAVNPATADLSVHEPITLATPIDHGFSGVGTAYIATPELLHFYGTDPATIDDATDLLTGLS